MQEPRFAGSSLISSRVAVIPYGRPFTRRPLGERDDRLSNPHDSGRTRTRLRRRFLNGLYCEGLVYVADAYPQLFGDLAVALALCSKATCLVKVNANWTSPEANPTTASGCQALDGALTVQLALHLGACAEHVHLEAARRCRGVDAVGGGDEVNVCPSEVVHELEQMSQAAGEAIELPADHEPNPTNADEAEHRIKLGSPVPRAADADVHVLADDLPSPLFGKLPESVELHVGALLGGGHPRVERGSPRPG